MHINMHLTSLRGYYNQTINLIVLL